MKQYGPRYHEIRDHATLIQGVAFDPLGSMMVTQSADKSVRIYKKSKKGRRLFCAHHIRERETDFELNSKSGKTGEDGGDDGEDGDDDGPHYFHHKYFHDDGAATFFRRPCWSPEGQFLLLPCGQAIDSPTQAEAQNVTWMFTRANLGKVAACCLPSNEISIAARFSPILYKSHYPSPQTASNTTSDSISSGSTTTEPSNAMVGIEAAAKETNFKLFDIDYRLVFAVATLTSIYVYDTEHIHPIAALQDAHYSTLTDLSWSSDGNILAISSADGYVSLIQFDNGELGEVLDKEHYDSIMAPVLEARIPKPAEPRKPKKSAASNGTGSDATTAKDEKDAHNMDNATDAANGSKMEVDEEDDDDDSEVDGDEALNGTIINFDEPAAPEPEKKPVVRKEGRRVVPTLVTSPLPTSQASNNNQVESDTKSNVNAETPANIGSSS